MYSDRGFLSNFIRGLNDKDAPWLALHLYQILEMYQNRPLPDKYQTYQFIGTLEELQILTGRLPDPTTTIVGVEPRPICSQANHEPEDWENCDFVQRIKSDPRAKEQFVSFARWFREQDGNAELEDDASEDDYA